MQGCCSWQSDCATAENQGGPSSKMCARSAGNESLNEMEYMCFRVGSSNRIHRSGWRAWSCRVQTTGRFIRERVNEFGPTGADEDVVQEAGELKHVPAPSLPFKAEVESHNVSDLPFRSWCSACVRGRGLSLGHRKVDTKTKEAEQVPTVSVDHGFFGQPEDRAHDTLPLLIVRDRKSKGIWGHPVPSKGVTHPYPARALMADLDFMGVQESHPQVRSGAQHCCPL